MGTLMRGKNIRAQICGKMKEECCLRGGSSEDS
jgi:translation initiation factor IF-1